MRNRNKPSKASALFTLSLVVFLIVLTAGAFGVAAFTYGSVACLGAVVVVPVALYTYVVEARNILAGRY